MPSSAIMSFGLYEINEMSGEEIEAVNGAWSAGFVRMFVAIGAAIVSGPLGDYGNGLVDGLCGR